jgi:hypothetical protein
MKKKKGTVGGMYEGQQVFFFEKIEMHIQKCIKIINNFFIYK